MPHWLRNTNVALLASLTAGCGSSGLYWVDAKLSQLSSPQGSVVGAPNRSASLREVATAKPAELPETRPAMTSARLDKMDLSAVGTPPKTDPVMPPRVADSEPALPKPLSRRDGPVPAAFALATPTRSIREIEKANHDGAWDKMTTESDVIAFADAEVDRQPPVSATSRNDAKVNDSAEPVEANHAATAASHVPENLETKAAASPIPKAVAARKLSISNMTLCQKIKGFGNVSKIEGALRTGGKALVYIETTGQTSRPSSEGVETRYQGKLRLTPTSGGPTLEWRFEDIVDVAAAERTQFFCHLLLSLPESLSEGDYRLEAVLDDVHGGSTASGETSLRVESDATSTK